MASNDDVKIKIGVDDREALSKITRFVNSAKARFAVLATAVAKAAKAMIDTATKIKLDVAIKEQTNQFNALASSLDLVIKKYDAATYKSERMANAIKTETAAQMQRLNAYKAMSAASYDIWRRGQMLPGMTPQKTFERGRSIDAAQRESDISYAEKIQEASERAAAADAEKIRLDKEATDRKISDLQRLRAQVMSARNAIPNAEDMEFNYSAGFADTARKARKRIDAAFDRTFGTKGGTAAFWNNPEIQNFKGSYSELSQKIGGMIAEAQRKSQTLGDKLAAAEINYNDVKTTGRTNISTMRDNAASIAADEARRYQYAMGFANEQRQATTGDRARDVGTAEREMQWARRMETADREGQRKIIEERRRYYEELAKTERELLKRFEGLREEELNDEDKWRRGRAEGRLYSYEDTLRGIGEEEIKWQKRGGDVEAFAFRSAQDDRAEQRAESLRMLQGKAFGGGAAMDGSHWLNKLQDVTRELDALASKYGAKAGEDGRIDYRTMDFRALQNNEYDRAVFDRLQGKADTYGGNLASAAAGMIEDRNMLNGKIVDSMANKNRLTAMGLGGGEAVADFGRATADNTKKANELLEGILEALGGDSKIGGGNFGGWGM